MLIMWYGNSCCVALCIVIYLRHLFADVTSKANCEVMTTVCPRDLLSLQVQNRRGLLGRLVVGVLAHISMDVTTPAPSYPLIVNDNDEVLSQAHIYDRARKRHYLLWKNTLSPDAVAPHEELTLVCDAR